MYILKIKLIMIIDTEVEVRANGISISYYKDKGYKFNCNEPFMVKINDLSHGSKIRVLCECSECGSHTKIVYKNYIKQTKMYNFYVCYRCKSGKYKSTCLDKYGVDNVSKIESIKRKKEETCLSNFGVLYPGNSTEIMDKVKNTCILKYGVDFYLQSEDIKSKTISTCLKKIWIYTSYKV